MENTNEQIESHIDHLVDIIYSIDPSKITILTGNNGSGKSLIRKQLGLRLQNENQKMKSVSMNLRTQSNPSFGALASMACDSEWTATSYNTFNLINKLFKSVDEKTDFICLDEFEIGCSEETVLAFTQFINQKLSELNIGALIITHSRLAVEHLSADEFINIQGLTKEEWLTRPLIPTNLDELSNIELFRAIRNRTKQGEN